MDRVSTVHPSHPYFWRLAKDLERDGLITIRNWNSFPDSPRILNYTSKAAHEKEWTPMLRACRGLIVTRDSIVARGWPKFFNVGEMPETQIDTLPKTTPEASLKLDGSLGILWKEPDGTPRISTRGSFHSEQAQWATKFFRNHPVLPKVPWPKGMTPLFEIIYPENRIVLDYGSARELALTGMVFNETGHDWSYREVLEFANHHRIPATEVPDLTLQEMIELSKEIDHEGWVLRYPCGLKVKVKGEWYRQLVRIIQKLSLKAITEAFRDQKHHSLLEGLPDHVLADVTKIIEFLTQRERLIASQIEEGWKAIGGPRLPENPDADDFRYLSMKIKALDPSLHKFLFAKMRGKETDRMVRDHLHKTRAEYEPDLPRFQGEEISE